MDGSDLDPGHGAERTFPIALHRGGGGQADQADYDAADGIRASRRGAHAISEIALTCASVGGFQQGDIGNEEV